MNDRKLLGKTAVVTGASRGLGLAIAQALAAAGCNLALCARNTKFLPDKDLADAYGIDVLVRECHVAKPESVRQFFDAVRYRYTTLDFLINNAGTAHPAAAVQDLPLDDWLDVIGTNLTGMFLCTQAALPLLNNGGIVVNNLSVAARTSFAGQAGYVASKHGARGLTEVLRQELRPRGIRVLALLPGATSTDLWNIFWPDAPREKMMSAETVAQAVVNALMLPESAAMEEMVIGPAAGTL